MLSLPSTSPVQTDEKSEARARLIVTADDFGLHPAINQAIIQAHEIGIVKACSIMPLGGDPAFDQAVEMAFSQPTLEVGLHFCLVGLPGQPATFGEFLPKFLTKRYPEIPVEAMVHRQLDLLERVGIKPTHINSHRHTHAIPDIMRAVCRAAVDRGIRSVRVPIDLPSMGTSLSRQLGAKAITEYAKRSKGIVEEYGLWSPDYFFGVADAGHITESRLMTVLQALPIGVTEISCHPGAHTGRLEAVLKWGYEWEAERKALISENVHYKIDAMDIGVTNFTTCAAEAAAKQANQASNKKAKG
jgi:chitin disaccharide deacetylase